MHIRTRYIPNSTFILASLDLVCNTAAQGVIFSAVRERVQIGDAVQLVSIVVLNLFTSLIFLYAAGCFRRDTLLNISTSLARLPIAMLISTLVVFIPLHFIFPFLYPTTPVYLSISGCAIIDIIGAGTSMVAAIASRAIFGLLYRRRVFQRRVLVVGVGNRAAYLRALLADEAHGASAHLIFVPTSVLGGLASYASEPVSDVAPILDRPIGTPIEIVADETGVDEIVVAVDERRGLPLNRLLLCKTRGIPVTNFETFIERETGRVDLMWLEPSWLIYSDGFQMRTPDLIIKRGFDVLFSLLILTLTLKVLVSAMIAIALEDGFPVFYRQERVTQSGRVFSLIKLRTMRKDAEKDGPRWASSTDNRITRVGGFLRRTRIDELPQLFNVLAGDMSLVGPRPERPIFIDEISKSVEHYDLRHCVRAGVTGWAQINYPYGASVEDSRKKLEYDLYYIKNYSILHDWMILLQTFRVVLWPEGVR